MKLAKLVLKFRLHISAIVDVVAMLKYARVPARFRMLDRLLPTWLTVSAPPFI